MYGIAWDIEMLKPEAMISISVTRPADAKDHQLRCA
jgi:hypothetical protein